MFSIVLFQPEIPPNTGNIIRLAANTGCDLHLVKPLGFPLEDAKLKRAGLDYHEYASMQVHEDWHLCLQYFAGRRIFAATTKGSARYDKIQYQPGDVFLFGKETAGLPDSVREQIPEDQRVRMPMRPNNRSLNLSNAVAIIVFEAWRQNGFGGAA